MDGADVFFGLSVADCVTPEMLMSMAENPIVFAMANPDPEIPYELAVQTRTDVIMATGRSDFPNQVNNVLGFPFIFRGALDVRATGINEEMKLAATRALAELAREDVPDSVRRAYGVERMEFGRDYIIPKPFDHRVLIWVASAVAKAAMDSGVARKPVDIDQYREQLERRLGKAHEVMRIMIHKAQRAAQAGRVPRRRRGQDPARLPDPDRRAHRRPDPARKQRTHSGEDGRAAPLARRRPDHRAGEPSPVWRQYTEQFFELRQRKGVTQTEAKELIIQSGDLRLDDATPGRRRRPDLGPQPELPRYAAAGATSDTGP